MNSISATNVVPNAVILIPLSSLRSVAVPGVLTSPLDKAIAIRMAASVVMTLDKANFCDV